MSNQYEPADEQDILLTALEMPEKEREGFLSEACRGNETLKDRLSKMLRVAQMDGSFMTNPVFELPQTIEMDAGESTGKEIGPYKLLEVIGEGGMGTVYMADQAKPVQRRVALKIIKAGMDTRQVVARFEAERQALAVMDHPNIAKVLDAGTTDNGRPYFVMELVKGIPITKYCNDKQLGLRERLMLVIDVCLAIQHAHQKGIIHRDIKPSNVLVTQYDGHPVPKVIDFGVAKATAQKLTEKTMFTAFGAVLGTLEYMSPEQAEMNQLDIDTRSDVYSLGVLTYELLTGTTPIDQHRLHQAAFTEMLRIIREEEPVRPSTRLSSHKFPASMSFAGNNEPTKLASLVKGELDWIVLKALEKDRARRYESASALGADLQRFLNDEAVLAGPTSLSYRFWKTARRHRTAALVTCILVLTIFSASVFSKLKYFEERAAHQEAEVQKAAAIDNFKRAEEQTLEAASQRSAALHETGEAIRQRDTARENLYYADMRMAQQYVEDNELARAEERLLTYGHPLRANCSRPFERRASRLFESSGHRMDGDWLH